MKYFIVVGEASGDLHASNLMAELKKVDPAAEFCFLGGDLMEYQGGKMIVHYRQMAFMGVFAVVKKARTVLGNLRKCKEAIVEFNPDVVILIDYPSFNLRIAKFVKKNLPIPVFYYISPKIWAWKEFRIKRIKKYIDKMYTILPFETEFYKKHGFEVEYVGNPSVDSVAAWQQKFDSLDAFCDANHFKRKSIIAILPGSRKQEIAQCLPRMIAAALRFSEFQVIVAGAPGIIPEFYYSVLPDFKFKIVFGETYELLSHSRAAIVNSGTATLETALLNIPEIVVYHAPFRKFGYWVKERLIHVKYISLVNLIAGKEVVRELVAHEFTPDMVSGEMPNMLFNEDFRARMFADYDLLRERLGKPGAAKHAASKIFSALTSINK